MAIADVGGAFVLRGLEPGTFGVRVRAFGHLPRDTVVSVANGRSSALDVVLQPVVSRLDAVVVQSTRDSTSAMTFDRKAIEQSGRREPGDHAIRRAGASHVSIRGSAASEVLVLVNGAPINSAITGDADVSSIGLERAERVQVLTGAQSARYGGRALAGVILVETRRAERELSGTASAGAWGERNASVAIGQTGESREFNSGIDWRTTATFAAISAEFRTRGGGSLWRVNATRGRRACSRPHDRRRECQARHFR
jgi:iron complex outermembrane receptor protein